LLRQAKLLDEIASGVEVLVPRDIWEGLIDATDSALEEDHAQSRIEDLAGWLVAPD
jgi:hypothetical protein